MKSLFIIAALSAASLAHAGESSVVRGLLAYKELVLLDRATAAAAVTLDTAKAATEGARVALSTTETMVVSMAEPGQLRIVMEGKTSWSTAILEFAANHGRADYLAAIGEKSKTESQIAFLRNENGDRLILVSSSRDSETLAKYIVAAGQRAIKILNDTPPGAWGL